MNNVTKLINIINNYFSSFLIKQKKINYIEDFDLINKTIISFGFDESPNYILYVKNEKNHYIQYKSKINNYPNYLLKNNQKFSKNLFKNIKIKSIIWHNINNQKYYLIEDFNDNYYKLLSLKSSIK